MTQSNSLDRPPGLCSICLPIYNEEEGLPKFLDLLAINLNAFESQLGINFEIIAVDDGSTDLSLTILKSYADRDSRIRVFAFQQNAGHQAAILCGLSHSRGDLIITMDSDGQDPPESIEKLICAHLQSHHEIIIARRRTRKDGLLKKVTAFIFYRILVLFGVPAESRDAGDYRLVTKRIKDLILSQPNSLQYIRGQIFTLKTATRMVDIDRKDRIAGQTKYTLQKMVRLAISSAFVIDPLKVAQVYISVAAIFTMITALVGGLFVIIKVVYPSYYSSGITTLALMILFLFTIVISMIAFQSLYMSLLFRSLRNEPAYLEKQV
ncbi:MAG: glycosyltransferase family 2 protein [Synechococcus sp.]|nr:glycosyltransferase family 2 protein [Synechococcus sp.]